MTCIVGLIHDGAVHLGADSAGVSGLEMQVRADPKLFNSGPFQGGFTSSFRMGQLLGHAWKPPKQKPGQDVMTFMVTNVVDSLRKLFKAAGYATSSTTPEVGGQFLLTYRGALYVIESDYSVGVAADHYTAIGCGADLACGALHATASLGLPPSQRLRLALEAAERHSAGVRAPFIFQVADGAE